jgi:hypothetical protein
MPWELTGNASIDPANNFLGTIDDQPLAIRTSNLERILVTPAGDVGIGGTPTPGARLTVVRGGATVNGVAVGTTVPDIDYRPFEYETVGVADPNMHLRLQSPNLIIFHTGDTLTPKMAITEAGSIGIGTDNPGARLHVRSDPPPPPIREEAQLRLESATHRTIVQMGKGGALQWDFGVGTAFPPNPPNNDFWFGDFADYRLVIQKGTGNVGIGTNNPGAKLDISGSGGANQCCAPAPTTLSLAEASSTQNRQAWLQFHNAGEAEAFLQLTTTTTPTVPGGMENRVEITNRGGGRLTLWTVAGGDIFNITRAGNIGIGTLTVRVPPVSPVPGELILGGDTNVHKWV